MCVFKQLTDSITFTLFSVLWFDSRTHNSFTQADASHFVMWNESGQLGQCQSFAPCVLAGTMKVVRGQVRRARTTTCTQYDPLTSLASTWFDATNTFQEPIAAFFFLLFLSHWHQSKNLWKTWETCTGQKHFSPPPQLFSIVHWFQFSIIVLSAISVKFSVKRLFFYEVALKQ